MAYTFSKLPIGAIASTGTKAHIHRSAFASAWLSDTHRISIPELVESPVALVAIAQDDSHPQPHRIEEELPNAIRKRPRTPTGSIDRSVTPAQYYSPESPTSTQIDLPEIERPASRPPADEAPRKRRKEAIASSGGASTQIGSPIVTSKSHSVHDEPISPPGGFRHVQLPDPPTITPSPCARALEKQIDEAVALEADRLLQRMGIQPAIKPAQPMNYGPPASIIRPSLSIPDSSSWNPMITY